MVVVVAVKMCTVENEIVGRSVSVVFSNWLARLSLPPSEMYIISLIPLLLLSQRTSVQTGHKKTGFGTKGNQPAPPSPSTKIQRKWQTARVDGIQMMSLVVH